MKIFFYRYGSIMEPDIIDTFREFGFEVYEYTKEVTDKNYLPGKAVRDVSAFLQKNPCDIAFSINFFPFLSDVANIFHIRYVSWTVDSPVMELYSSEIKNEWNRTFIFDKADFLDVSPFNPDHIFYLPLGANTSKKEKLFNETSDTLKEKFSHDVAFVGSLYSEKCPYDKLSSKTSDLLRGYLDGIMAAQERVYGYYFIEELLTNDMILEFKNNHPSFYEDPGASELLTDKRTLSQLYIANKITANERQHTFALLSENFDTSIYTASDTTSLPKIHNLGLAKSLTEMPVIFNSSKININTTSKAIRSGLPLRIFDILSAGGFCLSNYQSEIPELFSVGEEIVLYSSYDELIDLTQYYLTHDSERREIARAGYERVKKDYSLEKQLEKMMLMAYGQEA